MVTQVASSKVSGAVADEATLLVLDVHRIQHYERNPRHGRNPEFDRIKASIRTSGLDQPLVITQRPGATDYVVHSGGNTRLLILKELYRETEDERFLTVRCVYKPWTCELDILVAHLRENELRGSLTFIDKAQAVFDIKGLLEEEMELAEISQRRLGSVLKDCGYSISQGLISQMRFAVDVLLPVIPVALQSGMGRPQVEQIRKLESAARSIWQQRELGDTEAFAEVFSALCRRYDVPDWNTELLSGALETEIADLAEMSVHTVRVEFDALIEGREVVIPVYEDEEEEPTADEKTNWLDGLSAPEHSGNDTKNSGDLSGPDDGQSDPSPESCIDQLLTTGQTGPGDLKSLRARAWTLAARLAQRNGIGDLVAPLSKQGLGFILRDVPDPTLADQLDHDGLSQVSMVWWQLAACAEMTVAPVEAIVAHLSSDSVLRQALEQQDAALLFNSVWTLDPGHIGYSLWRLLVDQDWHDLLNLMDTYRRIHHLAHHTHTALWEST